MFKKVFIWLFMLTIAFPLNAQNEANYNNNKPNRPFFNAGPGDLEKPLSKNLASAPPKKEITISSFLGFINKKAYAATIDEKEEKRILREEWKRLLGIDIFYPYFKAKEVEDWVSQKATIEFFNIKGRPKFENDQIKYIFKARF